MGKYVAGRVLLLQGPIGPFFSRLAEELESEGYVVFKIHFNGGDEACYHHGEGHRYTGDLAGWPDFFATYLEDHAIDRVFLFGDCRPYHSRAIEVARRRDVAVFVFEQGYIRPDYITLERGGVNGHSSLPREAGFYRNVETDGKDTPASGGSGFWPVAWNAVRYYLAAWIRRRSYPAYVHHRPLNPCREGLCWLFSGLRKWYYMVRDRRTSKWLGRGDERYYFAPLQVHCDAQMTHHSGGYTVESFIGTAIASFAANASKDTLLVFKHHPMDRAYYNHRRLINVLARQHGVYGRVYYLHEGHLPRLLQRAVGTVVVNSTVGLSSVFHRTPVKVLGKAAYDIAGLTYTGTLADFWQKPGDVDSRLYRQYRQYLVGHVLGNGNFHRRTHISRGATGVNWPFGSLTAATDPGRHSVIQATARKPAIAVAPEMDQDGQKMPVYNEYPESTPSWADVQPQDVPIFHAKL